MSISKRPLRTAPSVERIGNAQEFELVKISVGGPDIGDSMFPHDRRDGKIVKPRARHVRKLRTE